MKRVLIVQPFLQADGGGNAVAAWFLQALRDEYELTLFTLESPSLERVNAFYGTSLRPGDFRVALGPQTAVRWAERLPTRVGLLKFSMLSRAAKEHVADNKYDALICTANEMDFGRHAGIQYVHYPWDLLPRPRADFRWYHAGRAPLWCYRRFCTSLAGKRDSAIRRNRTLVNSRYIGEKMAARYGVDSETLFPPVKNDIPAVPWERREDGFVCIGRFTPEKEFLKVIDIVEKIHSIHPRIKLHIVGSEQPCDYVEQVVRAANRRDFVTVHQDLSRQELVKLISENRYGVHGMVGEHFGIAVAELVTGGCVTFVPDSGGPVEIVGDESRVQYSCVDEAVQKIDAVLRSTDLQEQLRRGLKTQSELFTMERFSSGVCDVVDGWIRDGGGEAYGG